MCRDAKTDHSRQSYILTLLRQLPYFNGHHSRPSYILTLARQLPYTVKTITILTLLGQLHTYTVKTITIPETATI